MKFLQAKKLHNGDQVISKQTGKVFTVMETEKKFTFMEFAVPPIIFVTVVDSLNNSKIFTHTDIK